MKNNWKHIGKLFLVGLSMFALFASALHLLSMGLPMIALLALGEGVCVLAFLGIESAEASADTDQDGTITPPEGGACGNGSFVIKYNGNLCTFAVASSAGCVSLNG